MIDMPGVDLRDFELIVSDIDQTLIGQDHLIHPFTQETVFRLRKAGFGFTLATGKSLPGTIDQADALQIDLPMILINGGMLQTRKGKVLHAETLETENVQEVIVLCETHGYDLVMYSGDGIYYREMNPNLQPVYGHLTQGMHPIGDWQVISGVLEKINKCLVVDTGNPRNLEDLSRLFERSLSGGVDIRRTSEVLLEVMPEGVNKLTGLTRLTESMGIPLAKVMAIGDYDNDVEMLSGVGLGVAVANASPRAKASADLVVGDVASEGAAHFLADLLDRLPA